MPISKPAWQTNLIRTGWTLVFFLPLFLIIAVTQWLQEYFPFSHFPMYDNMSNTTFYVYLTDGEDIPIPAVPVTGERVAKLKRIYDRQIRQIHRQLGKPKYALSIDDRLPAALHTLNWLKDTALSRPGFQDRIQDYDSIRLYQAMITIEDGKISQPPPELVGEIKISDQN